MMVKVFYPNKNGKIEFTKEGIEKLLDEVYNQGYRDGQNHHYWWSSPNITTTPYYGTNSPTALDPTYTVSKTTTTNTEGDTSISYSITPETDGICINVSSHWFY